MIPPEYKIEIYKPHAEAGKKPVEERLLVKKKADLGGDRVTEAHAGYGNEGWEVCSSISTAKAPRLFGKITEAALKAIGSPSSSTA